MLLLICEWLSARHINKKINIKVKFKNFFVLLEKGIPTNKNGVIPLTIFPISRASFARPNRIASIT